eukprot:jgi/Mesvir1/28513/Mv08664-RA.1
MPVDAIIWSQDAAAGIRGRNCRARVDEGISGRRVCGPQRSGEDSDMASAEPSWEERLGGGGGGWANGREVGGPSMSSWPYLTHASALRDPDGHGSSPAAVTDGSAEGAVRGGHGAAPQARSTSLERGHLSLYERGFFMSYEDANLDATSRFNKATGEFEVPFTGHALGTSGTSL